MRKLRLLDLFCGAGGAGMGYHLAGFDVVGVDIKPQPRYPFEFHQADALDYSLDGFDAVHASPPCQEHSQLATFRLGHDTGWMLPVILERFRNSRRPYVVENVMGARPLMPGALMICGASLGLATNGYALRRHRLFASNTFLMGPGCACPPRTLGVYGNGGGRRPPGHSKGWTASRAESKALMGIDWMTRGELAQAIPPAYTRFIGEQLIAHLERKAATI
jgi:DNA (cytosine-5)-methyltransferase 1